MLFYSRNTHFTEPLDRVYALMGIVDNGFKFQPDYTLTRKELLRKVFEAEIGFCERHYFGKDVQESVSRLIRAVDLDFPFFGCTIDQEDRKTLSSGDTSSRTIPIVCRMLRQLEIPVPPGIRSQARTVGLDLSEFVQD